MNLSIETLSVLLLFFPGLLASAVLTGVLKRPDVDATRRLIEAILFTIGRWSARRPRHALSRSGFR